MSHKNMFESSSMKDLTEHIYDVFATLTPAQRNRIRRGRYSHFFKDVDKCYQQPTDDLKSCILEGIHDNCIAPYEALRQCRKTLDQTSCKDKLDAYSYCFHYVSESLKLTTFVDI